MDIVITRECLERERDHEIAGLIDESYRHFALKRMLKVLAAQ